jgi:UDP-N-acetylglucosamine 2-epimerase (non-hydrolysing)
MDQQLRVATIVGTRLEAVRLSRVIAALRRHTEHVLIHTGREGDHEANRALLEDLEIKPPDRYLDVTGGTSAEAIGRVIIEADKALGEVDAHALLVVGDGNSSLAAIAARRRRIPVFHMEAGTRCFDDRVPEEMNRRIVDHVADVNLPYSSISRDYLLREGLPPDRVVRIGSPMYEVFHHYMPKIEESRILSELELEHDGYFLVVCDREEDLDTPRRFPGLVEILNNLAETTKKRVIVSTHPGMRRRFEEVTLDRLVELREPFPFSDHAALELSASVVLSDSSSLAEEASILNLPALDLRETHERPEGMEEAVVMTAGPSWPRVQRAVVVLCSQPRGVSRVLEPVADYEVPNVSEKVVRIILSYAGG